MILKGLLPPADLEVLVLLRPEVELEPAPEVLTTGEVESIGRPLVDEK